MTTNTTELSIIYEWHKMLLDNSAGCAQLKRCKSLNSVFFIPEYHRLYQRLSKTKWKHRNRIALLAIILSHVEKHIETSLGDQMAESKSSGSPKVSLLRFQRLLEPDDPETQLTAFIRLIHLLKQEVNIDNLSRLIYYWSNQRRELAFHYYKALPET
ncbi:type I-E CRISPR-associated protein Cse2/CasB [Candidatus Venteria ishoeyi]|uniref:CRISPR-associated protein Cse2 (CRISPR_cse2) n=1 Tax=Candidatus Venteria ishoeyi TaxID=1899563 RepID=A0A1H6F7V6_9GAMM|nr:type I-E CRISPR-associated protein Cse2/CasB [Candidatus Venteria ishoeyi]SEH05471.1 CRISPR-associated protein Cse2 (CRISPR_cse2) [Candidatus Venteria ishoeyi]